VTVTAGTGRLGVPDEAEGAAPGMTDPPTAEKAVSALITDTASLAGFAVTLGSVVPLGALDGFDVKGTRERGRWFVCEDARLETGLPNAVPGIPAVTSPLPPITPGTVVGLGAAAAVAPGLTVAEPAGLEILVLDP